MGRRTAVPPLRGADAPARRRLRWRWLLVPLLLIVALGVALAVSAVLVRGHLRDARVAVAALQHDALDPHATSEQMRGDVVDLQRSAHAAAGQTDSLLWQVPAAVPVLGRPARTLAGVSGAVRDLADRVLPALTTQRGLLIHSLQRDDGSIRLRPLVDAQSPIAHSSLATQQILQHLDALPHTGIGAVDTARQQLTTQVEQLGHQLGVADKALHLLPPMLGQDGPRRYFVAFQNDTEARGLGGLPGAYAILRADHGMVSFERFGSDTDFSGVGPVSIADFGPDYQRLYQGAAPQRLFGNSNVSPHLPYAAKLWMRYWQAKSGQRLDGAITMDPSALALLLKVTGPAELPDGSSVGADNVVALTESIAYARYDDPERRRAFNILVAKAVAERLLAGGPDRPAALAGALGKAVGERRLLVWSAHPTEEDILAASPVGGTLSPTPDLFAGVVINNAAGSKLDYYLKRDVRYRGPACDANPRTARVTITLTNTAPKHGLPAYVAARTAKPLAPGLPRGTERLLVGYHGTKGALLGGATLDGKQELLTTDVERGRPVFTATLEIPPQRSRTLALTIIEPSGAKGPVTTLVQPLVLPQTTHTSTPTCVRGSSS